VARIDRFASRTQAELASGFLQAHGFEAYVSGDDAGGLHPDIAFGIGGTAVVVPDERLAEALELLDREFGSELGDDGSALAGTEPVDRSVSVPVRLVVGGMLAVLLAGVAVSTAMQLFPGWFGG
jgi:hypothetical protein